MRISAISIAASIAASVMMAGRPGDMGNSGSRSNAAGRRRALARGTQGSGPASTRTRSGATWGALGGCLGVTSTGQSSTDGGSARIGVRLKGVAAALRWLRTRRWLRWVFR